MITKLSNVVAFAASGVGKKRPAPRTGRKSDRSPKRLGCERELEASTGISAARSRAIRRCSRTVGRVSETNRCFFRLHPALSRNVKVLIHPESQPCRCLANFLTSLIYAAGGQRSSNALAGPAWSRCRQARADDGLRSGDIHPVTGFVPTGKSASRIR
jgi:hypothetical protein